MFSVTERLFLFKHGHTCRTLGKQTQTQTHGRQQQEWMFDQT